MATATPAVTYDYNTGKVLAPGQAQSQFNTTTGQKIGSPLVPTTPNAPITPAAPTTTTPVYNPPAPGGATQSTPVITSAAATADAAAKLKTYNDLQAQVANQKSVAAQMAAQDAANKAKADSDAAQLKLQQQAADTATTTANAKASAISAANSPTTTQTTDTGNGSTTTTTPSGGLSTNTGDATTDNLNGDTNQYNSDQEDLQAQKDTLTNTFASQLNSVMAGTFPLSAPQSALISSLQSQLAQNVQSQTVSNNSYTGAVTEAAFRSGGEYTPAESAGAIQNAVSTGIQKIQDLDNSAASTLAQVEQGFQKDDYDMINTQYSTLSKQLDDKASAIKDMYDTTVSAIKDQRDSQAAAAQTAFDNNLKSEQFDYTKAQGQIDDLFKNAQITETQRHDMQTEANSAASTQIAAQKESLDQATFNVQYGAFVNPDGSTATVSPSQIPGYTQAANGSSVIVDANGLYKTSSVGGLPVVSAGNAKDFTTNATTAGNISKLQVMFNQIASGKSSDTAPYNALLATLPTSVQSQLPTFSAIGNFNNTNTANTKFNAALTSVNSTLSGLANGYTPPTFGQTFTTMSSAGDYLKETGQTAVYNNYKAQGYSDPQILQLLNGQ